MRTHDRNKIHNNWAKLNHVHYCAIYFKAKDIQNFIRHFLFLCMNFAGEYKSGSGSLRADIISLTRWDRRAITNAITRLKASGEIERVNSGVYRLNPAIANRFGFIFKNRYEGKEPDYETDPSLKYMVDALQKLIHTRSLPASRDEYEKMRETELNEADEMVALMKIERLEQTVEKQNELLMGMQELLKELMTKVDPDTQIKVKRHLELVTDK